MRTHWMIAAVMTLLATNASAAPLMVYSARLYDTNNSALSGTHDFVFRIFDVVTAGTPLFEEGKADVDTQDGYFSVMLGNNELTAGLDLDALFAVHTSALYLEVQVDGEALSPRQPLGAVPWAYGGNTLATLSCSVNQIPRWNGSAWVCDDDNVGTPAASTVVSAAPPLTSNTAGNTVSLGFLSCAPNKTLKTDGSGVWSCLDDALGSAGVTSVAASSPLGVSATTGAVTFSLTPCATGEVLVTDGSATGWLCATPISGVTAGAGLSGGGSSGNVSLSVNYGAVMQRHAVVTTTISSSSTVLTATNSGSGSAIAGYATSNAAVFGSATNGYGVYGSATSGYAGFFNGKARVGGKLELGGVGTGIYGVLVGKQNGTAGTCDVACSTVFGLNCIQARGEGGGNYACNESTTNTLYCICNNQ